MLIFTQIWLIYLNIILYRRNLYIWVTLYVVFFLHRKNDRSPFTPLPSSLWKGKWYPSPTRERKKNKNKGRVRDPFHGGVGQRTAKTNKHRFRFKSFQQIGFSGRAPWCGPPPSAPRSRAPWFYSYFFFHFHSTFAFPFFFSFTIHSLRKENSKKLNNNLFFFSFHFMYR